MDVKSIYISIPNSERIAVAKTALDKKSNKTAAMKFNTIYLALILTLNNFAFTCTHFLQLKGYAMDNICALSYANIFMAGFEGCIYIYIYISFTYIYSLIRSMLMLYCQYIDDIIMIWKGNYGDLTNVLHNINKQQQTIKPDFGI